MAMYRQFVCSFFFVSLLYVSGYATTFYVSPTGNDGASGLSPATAWRTLNRAGLATYGPGDSLLFEGSQTFNGTLWLPNLGSGTAVAPVYIGSYGTGRATIDSGNNQGAVFWNVHYLEINGLNFSGNGRTTNNQIGLFIYHDLPAGVVLPWIRVRNLHVSGYNQEGLMVYASNWNAGFSDVLIENVHAYDNGHAGIIVSGNYPGELATGYCHQNVVIRNCKAYNNPGEIGLTGSHTGSGIIVSNTEGALIEYCEAYNNGADNAFNGGGPVGIWFWDVKDGIIQHSESHHNHTSSTADGGGFDLDGGCVNCILQYNYSHNNDGAGYLVAHFFDSRPTTNNVIRFNISQNDGRKNGYGGVYLWRAGGAPMPMTGVKIYHNTLFISPSTTGSPAAIKTANGNFSGISVYNNLFLSAAGAQLVNLANTAHAPDFLGNGYYATGTFAIRDGGTVYSSLAAWRAATGKENHLGTPVGLQADPLVVGPGLAGTIGAPYTQYTLPNYQLSNGSPAMDAGLDLLNTHGIAVGIRDFFGTPLGATGTMDIGAHYKTGGPLATWQAGLKAERVAAGKVFLSWNPHLPRNPKTLVLERAESPGGPFFPVKIIESLAESTTTDHEALLTRGIYRLAMSDDRGLVFHSHTAEVAPFQEPGAIRLYPNPVDRNIQVEGLSAKETASWKLFDLTGRTLAGGHLIPVANPRVIHLPETVANGVFLVQIHTSDGVFHQLIQVHHQP